MSIAVYPGSFDPETYGPIDIIEVDHRSIGKQCKETNVYNTREG